MISQEEKEVRYPRETLKSLSSLISKNTTCDSQELQIEDASTVTSRTESGENSSKEGFLHDLTDSDEQLSIDPTYSAGEFSIPQASTTAADSYLQLLGSLSISTHSTYSVREFSTYSVREFSIAESQ